jgi:VWFA-related protein
MLNARTIVFMCVGLLAAALAATSFARNAGDPKPQTAASQNATEQAPPRLTSSTRLVQVSVVVHDKHNDPVLGLKRDDFVITDEKKPQAIQIFDVETNDVPKVPPAPLPPNTYTNRVRERSGVPTSITVILLDGLNTQVTDQTWARKYVAKFLQQIQPQDRVALYSLGHNLRVLHDFTSDSTSLLAALGQSPAGQTQAALDASTPQQADTGNAILDMFLNDAYAREANVFIGNRVHQTVEALTLIADHVGTLPGRKNLVWVSGSFPFSVGYDNIVPTTNDANVLFADDIETATRALTNANIAVYPVDARGLIGPDTGASANSGNPYGGSTTARAAARSPRAAFKGPDPANFDTMQTMADRTGGRAFFNTNDIYGAIREALNDSRVTYELGYYPQDVKWDGTFHNIKVEVKQPGVHVRARKGYFALPEPKITLEYRQALIAETVTSPLEATGIGVKVQVASVENTGARKMKAVVYFDPHDFTFEQKDGVWLATVDSVFVQIDDKNAIVDALDQTFHLHLDPATYQRLLKEGMTYTKEIPIKDTTMSLRVVLRDGSNGNIGDVSVPLAKYFPAHSSAAN